MYKIICFTIFIAIGFFGLYIYIQSKKETIIDHKLKKIHNKLKKIHKKLKIKYGNFNE